MTDSKQADARSNGAWQGVLELCWNLDSGRSFEYIKLAEVKAALLGEGKTIQTTEHVLCDELTWNYVAQVLREGNGFVLEYRSEDHPNYDKVAQWGKAVFLHAGGDEWDCSWHELKGDQWERGRPVSCRKLRKLSEGEIYEARARKSGSRSVRDSRFRSDLIAWWRSQSIDIACAMTGERVREALDAAHVREVQTGGSDCPESNGLLLRKDVHKLFDCGLIKIEPDDGSFWLHPSVEDAKSYACLRGQKLAPAILARVQANLRVRLAKAD